MSRLDDLRTMRAFIDREIDAEIARATHAIRSDPAVRSVSDLYGVSTEEILLGVRRHEVTRARHAATWLLRQRGMSLAELADALGYSGPGGAWAALRRVETDQAMRALLIGLEGAA